MEQKKLNFLDRNEFNYAPSEEVVEAQALLLHPHL